MLSQNLQINFNKFYIDVGPIAFAIFWILVLVGTASKKEMDYLIALVDDLELKSRVVFTGNVPRISVTNFINICRFM